MTLNELVNYLLERKFEFEVYWDGADNVHYGIHIVLGNLEYLVDYRDENGLKEVYEACELCQ